MDSIYSSKISQIIRAINGEASDDTKYGIHCIAIKSALNVEASVATSIISFYLHLNDLESARSLFYLIPTKDFISCTAMITGLSKCGEFMEAINMFRSMQSYFDSPNLVSFLSVLPACANTGSLQYGKQIHGSTIRREWHMEGKLQNSLIDMYAKCCNMNAASLVFDAMETKDDISWKNLIIGCIQNGVLRKAIGYFSRMRTSQVEPGEIIVRNLIAICPQLNCFKFGIELHCCCIKNGLLTLASIGAAILKMYADFKEIEMAQLLFSDLQHKDHITWSMMMSVCSHTKQAVRALKIFNDMVIENVEVNEITLVSLLQACSLLRALELGRCTHGHLIKLGYNCNAFVISSLINFYCKLGILGKAEILFNSLQEKDLVCWSSMIHGYGINGHGEKAIRSFSAMLDQGLMPNEIVFVSLLSACSRCGFLDEGWKWFNSMEEKFGVTPSLAHYACIVDLLGRKGKVERALEVIRTMPFEPDGSIWIALLSWCGTSDGDLKVAEIAAEKLVRIDQTG
ncbi:pentatricopeptide repeat-containing protein At3g53360, mitochondrial-like [Dendrobium catenatum]|nr:pentatricopeptide repeat-containing protein At3g53360, mitochondrial-like [Dendrobium catenatum]